MRIPSTHSHVRQNDLIAKTLFYYLRIKELLATQPEQESSSKWVSAQPNSIHMPLRNPNLLIDHLFSGRNRRKPSMSVVICAPWLIVCDALAFRIKKPKTHRYPSLKGTDPKFRRNHRHALHGTMKALVSKDENITVVTS